MSKFESIRIQGFRRLVDVKLKLRPLMVMIGANGSGKTSFLEAWQLLAGLADGKLADTFASLGGFGEVLTRQLTGHPAISTMSLRLQITEPDGWYSIRLKAAGLAYYVEDETASNSLHPQPNTVGTDVFPSEACLSTTQKGKGGQLHSMLSSQFLAKPIEVAEVRRPQSVRPSLLPGTKGELLVSCLYSLRETDRDRFEVIEDWLHTAFPDFERLEFPPVAAGMLALAWKDRRFTQPIYMHQLSEGTLRFLWLTTLLSSRHLPAVTLIDEPEVSLHPQLLMLLVGMMREAAMRSQIIVATQSESLVRFLNPNEVLVADVEDGATKFTWGEDLDLDHWLEDYSLNELWTMGVLGGRV